MAEEVTNTPGGAAPAPETSAPEVPVSAPETLLNPGEVKAENSTQDTESKGTEEDQKTVVPEKYEFKAPEGMTLDQAGIERFTPIAKELGLSNEGAQKLLEVHAESMKLHIKSQQEAFTKQQENWAAEFKADKTFGGDAYTASLASANNAWKAFATPEEITAVHAAGLANYPPLVRILARVGKEMAEDKLHMGGPTTPKIDPAKIMYPSMN